MEKEVKSGAEEISVEQLDEVVGGASYVLSSSLKSSLSLPKSIFSAKPVLRGDLVKMTCGSYNI